MSQQLSARNAFVACAAAFLEPVHQAHVGQLGDDDELAVNNLVALERKQERVANFLNAPKGLEFLFGSVLADAAINDLDGLAESSRRSGLPDLTVAAGAEPDNQLVSRYGFRASMCLQRRHNFLGPAQRPQPLSPYGYKPFCQLEICPLEFGDSGCGHCAGPRKL